MEFMSFTSPTKTNPTTLDEIESAIAQLAPNDLARLAAWFDEFHAEAWDKQIEDDANTGRLDALLREAEEAYQAGQCRPL